MNGKKSFGKIMLSALLVMAMMLFSACGTDTQLAPTQPVDESTPDSVETETAGEEQMQQPMVEVQTKYTVLSYPESYKDVLSHQEIVSDAVTMEIFSMEAETGAMELFRIWFGDDTTGSVAGYLNVDGTEIPVSYTICQYNDDEFADEDVRKMYCETMNCINDIMDGIHSDERFSTEKAQSPVENGEINLAYWTFTLPSSMECEEIEENGQYEVSFYGNVAGEKIALYTISVGDTERNTVLGTYVINGEAKTLSLESYEIVPVEGWSDAEWESVYAMMATINDVLPVIMSSENFSEQMPE